MENFHFVSENSVKFLKMWKELKAYYQKLAMFHEKEMFDMIDVLDATRIEWSKSASECNRLTSLNESLQRENSNLTTELRNTQDLHLEAQAQLKLLHTTIQGLQHNITEYEKRFHLVKKILREQNAKFAADIDVDKLMSFPSSDSPRRSHASRTNTEENTCSAEQCNDVVEAVPRKNEVICPKSGLNSDCDAVERRSASQEPIRGAVLKKFVEVNAGASTSTNTENPVPCTPKKSRAQYFGGAETCVSNNKGHKKSSIRRSISESNLLESQPPTLCSSMVRSIQEMRTTQSTRNNTWTKGRFISECGHIFINIRFQMLGNCAVCSKSFSYTRYKCKKCENCNLYFHEACVPDAPMPCVPPVKTPQKSQKRRRLADMCTNERPQLPPAIVRCVVALEKNYLNTVGLYRVPGLDSVSKDLSEALISNTALNMNKINPEIICSTVKRILRELQDPLIPRSSYNEFIKAADENNRDQLMTAIGELPLPNRHTLAYLCTHWQNVAHNSNVNQMPIENIATCLGPTICGVINPQHRDVKAEIFRQNSLLRQLLEMEQGYWQNMLYNSPVKEVFGATRRALITAARHPEMNADHSMLGHVLRTPSSGPLIQQIYPHTTDRIKFQCPY